MIIRKIFSTIILCIVFVWSTGTAQEKNIDRVVAVVGNEVILYSDIESEVNMMRSYGTALDEDVHCKVLEDFLFRKLLLTQARVDSISVNDEDVKQLLERRIQDIMAKLGGEKATEQYFRKPMHQLRKELREPIHEYLLTQQIEAKLKKDIPITPSEVEQAFKKIPTDSLPIISEKYVLRQVVILPPESSAKFDARQQLLELRERILKGEKFSTLAIMYSEDPGSARRGGELGMAPAQRYTKPFSDAASLLKPDQVSSIVETENGFHLIQMIEKESNDMWNARHILLKPKYTSEDRGNAFKQLDSIADLVRNGTIIFEQAAQKYSQDTKTNANGGLMVNEYNLSSQFEKDQLYPADYAVLKNMKQGDISIPFETRDQLGNTQYKILQLVELIPSHIANLKHDYFDIQQLTQQQRQLAAFEQWIKNKQASTYIRIDEQYKNCKFEREGWVK